MAIPAMNLQPSGARLSFDGFELDEVDARLTCEGQSVPHPAATLRRALRTGAQTRPPGDQG